MDTRFLNVKVVIFVPWLCIGAGSPAPFCFVVFQWLCRKILYSNTLSGFSGVITLSVTAGDFYISHKAVVNRDALCSVLAGPFCLIDFNSVYKFVK